MTIFTDHFSALASDYDDRELVLAELMIDIAASDAFRFRAFEEKE